MPPFLYQEQLARDRRNTARYVLSGTSLREEGVEGIITIGGRLESCMF